MVKNFIYINHIRHANYQHNQGPVFFGSWVKTFFFFKKSPAPAPAPEINPVKTGQQLLHGCVKQIYQIVFVPSNELYWFLNQKKNKFGHIEY